MGVLQYLPVVMPRASGGPQGRPLTASDATGSARGLMQYLPVVMPRASGGPQGRPLTKNMPKLILIIDDEEQLAQALAAVLTEKGFAVRTAANGLLALEKIKKEKPDLIIADFIMPEMDGFEFYKELKKDSQTASIPVIIQTERRLVEGSFRVMGVEEFLLKPIKVGELCEKIDLAFKAVENKRWQPPLAKQDAESISPSAPQKKIETPAAAAGFGINPKYIKLFSLGLGFVLFIFGSYLVYDWLSQSLDQEASKLIIVDKTDQPSRGISAYALFQNTESQVDGLVEDYDEAGRLQAQLYYSQGKLLWKKNYNAYGIPTSVEHYEDLSR